MRIAILTQPLRYNFGGILQNYALQTVLKRMGHEVVTLQPDTSMRISWRRFLLVFPARVIRFLLGKSDVIRYEQNYNKIHRTIATHTRKFVEANINIRKYSNIRSLSEKDYDMIVVGSDQVWRPCYNNSFFSTIENSFLDFAKTWSVKRIAYAASFGTDSWEFSEDETTTCSELIKLFDAVSVRERSGIELCKNKFGVDAVHLLDPTLLLKKEDYVNLIENSGNTTKPTGELMCYILDETEDKKMLIARIAHEKNLTPFRANAQTDDVNASLSDRIQLPVEQWLRDFQEAELVVTDSFHACVFSIIFNKPFVVVGNKKRGMSRFQSLLETFGLKDHLLFSIDDYKSSQQYDIPDMTYEILSDMCEKSYKFLKTYIH